MERDIELDSARRRPGLPRLLVCLAIIAAGVTGAAWLGRGLWLDEPGTLSDLATTVMCAGFSLTLARIVWRWEAFAARDRLIRRLRRAQAGRKPLRRRLLRAAIFPGLPAAILAACPLALPSPETFDDTVFWARALAGLGGVVLVSLLTLLVPLLAAAGAAVQLPRMRRSGVLEELRVTPLAVERLPDALVGGQLRRRLGFLLAATPLYLLALNWAAWLTYLQLSLHGLSMNPVVLTGAEFFTFPLYWAAALGDYGQLPGSMLFGAILLVSDLLMCWRAAALGTWLGARFRNGAGAAVLAALGAAAMWGLRLGFFALAFGFQQHLVGPYERALAAFAADLLVFALVTPFCLDRAWAAVAADT